MFNSKNQLIVITGSTGSGKTTLAKLISKHYKIELISLDTIKEQTCDTYGFLNPFEKQLLADTAKHIFKAKLISKMRKGKSIVIEYPFNNSWQEFFNKVTNQYKYELIVVNCTSRDFDNIWEDKIARDKSESRHKSHLANKYIKWSRCEIDNTLFSDDYKALEQEKYTNNYYTSIIGDKILTDVEVRQLLRQE